MKINDKLLPQETVLYNHSTGTSGNVTLTDSTANYKYIEIFYRNGDNYVAFKRIYSPNGKKCGLNLSYYNDGIGHFQNWVGAISISGNTITHTKDYYTSNSTTAVEINYIFIMRVVGYY